MFLERERIRAPAEFGGPNGSGKSTIYNTIESNYDLGYYINADEIEKLLIKQNFIDLSAYGIQDYTQSKLNSYVKNHSLKAKAQKQGFNVTFCVENNRITTLEHTIYSYEASLIADIIRYEVLLLGRKFSFETVMSHTSKIDLLKKTKKQGYKNYLYFISTESPLINKERVLSRVKKGGHTVPAIKIESRYYQSMELLHEAIKNTYRAFIWDNSKDKARLILEVENGNKLTFHNKEVPQWVEHYVWKKFYGIPLRKYFNGLN